MRNILELVKNILITGANGQLGQELRRALKNSVHQVYAYSSDKLDVTNVLQLEEIVTEVSPDIFINCAAYTAVDKAESEEDLCEQVNTFALKYIGNLAAEYSFKVLHFSTDYVFSGDGSLPWRERDETLPLNVYGLTKRNGELALLESGCDSLILRVSGLYSEYGQNFPKTIDRLLQEKEELSVVDDQLSSPTWAKPLAEFIVGQLLRSKELFYGSIYHYSEEGECSWYDIAKFINRKYDKQIHAIPSSEYAQEAKRPLFSKLDGSELSDEFDFQPENWWDNLEEFLKIIQE